MKQTHEKYSTFGLIAIAIFFCISTVQAQGLIAISDTMVYQLAINNSASPLFDEKNAIGNPLIGNGQTVASFYDYTGNVDNENSQYVIDHGAYYDLSSLYFFDINAQDTIFISAGDIMNWSSEYAFVTDQYFQWHGIAFPERTRFIKLRFRTMGAKVGEMAIYGSLFSTLPINTPTPVAIDPKPMHEIIGTNGFVWSPDTLLEAIGSIREYRSWDWSDGGGSTSYSGYPNNEYAFSPAYIFDTDAFYQ